MVTIKSLKLFEAKLIWFKFSDGEEKIIDFNSLIPDNDFTKPLKDQAYFNQVKIYEDGRGIYWPNEYDFCPDFLRFHAQASDSKSKPAA